MLVRKGKDQDDPYWYWIDDSTSYKDQMKNDFHLASTTDKLIKQILILIIHKKVKSISSILFVLNFNVF